MACRGVPELQRSDKLSRRTPLSDSSLIPKTVNESPLKTVFKGDSLTVFGISDESDNGVLLDNLSLRCNSGTPLQAIPEQVLKQFNNYLKYDLIVLQYGTNVVATTETNMDWYEKGMIKVINRLKRNFPQADILL